MKEWEKLNRTRVEFEPYIKGKAVYTYIAPKNKQLYTKFFNIAQNLPALSGSMAEILSNGSKVRKILTDNFPKDTELEIYFATDDTYSSISLKGTLQQYIDRNNIHFDY